MIELLLNAFTNPQPEAINNHFGVVESQPKTEITLNLPLYTKQKRAKFRNQIQNIQNKVGETVKHPIIETKKSAKEAKEIFCNGHRITVINENKKGIVKKHNICP